MYEWILEDYKLMYEVDRAYINPINPRKGRKIKEYKDMRTTSREDKIEFIDRMNDNKLSYIFSLASKFEKDVKDGIIKKDKKGRLNSKSLIAWLYKNDTMGLGYREFDYGNICILGVEFFIGNVKDYYGIYDNLIDEIFHHQLIYCEEQEKRHFEDNDEYTIKSNELYNIIHSNKYSLFNYIIHNERIVLKSGESIRPLTLQEINTLIEEYKKIDIYVEQLRNTINIKY